MTFSWKDQPHSDPRCQSAGLACDSWSTCCDADRSTNRSCRVRCGQSSVVDEDEAVSAVADALRDFGLADDEDGSEFLILAQADNRARTIGPWLVNTVQAAGWDGEFVLEFIVGDETGDPRLVPAASGWPHRDTVDYDPDNPNTFDPATR